MISPRAPPDPVRLDDAPLVSEKFQEDLSSTGEVALHSVSLPQRPSPSPQQLQPPRQKQPTLNPPALPPCVIPLRRWIANEADRAGQTLIQQNKLSIIRKTTVAYAIAELLNHLRCHRSPGPAVAGCGLENFVVWVDDSSDATIRGVDMISPATSLRVVSDANNDEPKEEAKEEELGRYLEVEIQSSTDAAAVCGLKSSEEKIMCHKFGVLLYELFSGTHPFLASNEFLDVSWGSSGHPDEAIAGLLAFSASNEGMQAKAPSNVKNSTGEPSRKKTFSDSLSFKERDNIIANGSSLASREDDVPVGQQLKKYVPLKDLGFPASLSFFVKNLLECGWGEFLPDDAVPSLEVASRDLHLLLQEPGRFLFDQNPDRGRVLNIKQNKLYGRKSERSLISNAFCNVSLKGESEALFVEGYSGSGKSKLVQSLFEYVEISGGYVIRQKFDHISQESPMSVVIAAFNDLCPMVCAKRSLQGLMTLFGSHLSTLTRVLSNATLFNPELDAASSDKHHQNTEINLNRVCFILQLFMRVVSSKSHPVMLFLDDLHWADTASLDVLKYILTDIQGSSCVFFVGSYRSNEAPSDHAIFRFMSDLKKCGVRLNKIHLDGMEINDVNHIISDALGMFPRICMPLSQLVLRKTKGNPLFVLECLRSLVDRDLLQYSLRERCWVWDMEKINAEDIADNVCELFSTKMMGLPETSQAALKVASCFGNAVDSTVVRALTSNPPAFSTLQNELEKAVEAGFMNKDSSGSTYRFVHDKVQEAAYGLIEDKNKHLFHHNLGKFLYHVTRGQNIDKLIFAIANQINHGETPDPYLRVDIADINCRAASKAMCGSNFAAAYFYSNTAIKFLPRDHWENNYDLSRNIFLLVGNAGFIEGHYKEALSALDNILSCGRSLDDRLDAYSLKVELLNTVQEIKPAYDISVEVLKALGETILAAVDPNSLVEMAQGVRAKLYNIMDKGLMDMKPMDPFHCLLLKFYNQALLMSFYANPPMMKWYCCRVGELSLEHGMSKYAALGILRYAMVLGSSFIQDVGGAYRVGKMALSLIERFDATDLLPSAYLTYYSFIAVHIEPFQSCAEMLKRGLDIGLSNGNITLASFLGIHYIQKSLLGGTDLPMLKRECDYQMRLIDSHSRPLPNMYMSTWQETISILIDSGGPSNLSQAKEFPESLVFHGVLRYFWAGHYDRCLHYSKKSSDCDVGQVKSILTLFYGGLSCFHCNEEYTSNENLMSFVKNAMEIIAKMEKAGPWNYKNKIHLLEAEVLSATCREKNRAKPMFNAAIRAARSAKFVHEQGLACEFAALHCLKHGDVEDASNLFQQALECYTEWGSQVKINSIKKHLENVGARKMSGAEYHICSSEQVYEQNVSD